MMELFGPIGIMRAGLFGYKCPISDQSGEDQYSKYTAKDFDKLFDTKNIEWNSIIDIINFQNSCYENLNTKTAQRIARKWLDYSRKFLSDFRQQLSEIQ
jgi:hypothetical protein